MKFRLLACSVMVLAGVLAGCDRSRVDQSRVERGGLSIDRLGSAEPEEFKLPGVKEGWSMVLPADEGFSPNVNWITEDVGSEMPASEYLAASLKQYDSLAAEILFTKVVSTDEAEILVKISMLGSHVMCFQRLLKDGKTYHVVTGSTREDLWEKYRDQMMDCVRSARVE